MTKTSVLLVDDDATLREIVRSSLEQDGYSVTAVSTAQELTDSLQTDKFNAILLDLILPDADGLSLISTIREYTDIPLIIISGKDESVDKVIGLEMGADDYVAKPLPLKELSSRIKAQVRRYTSMQNAARAIHTETGTIKFGRWTLDSHKVQVFDEAGLSCRLTAKEFRLLEVMVTSPNRVLSREKLLDQTRPDNSDVTDRAIDVQILRIRRKIGDTDENNQTLQSVRGVGYMLVTESAK